MIKTLDLVPLYPDEDRIALEVMGPKHAKEWPAKAKYLEDKHGLPRVDELMGGRFWPAVVEYFRRRHGLSLDTSSGPTSSSIRVRRLGDRVHGESRK